MDIDNETSSSQPYTILRIKRKRNEEPLDALVVESGVRRKKSRGGMNVFQFAQTVENDAWQDEKRKKDIQDQISRLSREAVASAESSYKIVGTTPLSTANFRPPKDEARRYTILEHDGGGDSVRYNKTPSKPPEVISAKDLLQKNGDFRLYDAVLANQRTAAPAGADLEMDKFLPLLQDYLKLHDVSLEPTAKPGGHMVSLDGDNPDDYVWDVFYQRPMTLTEWNEAANVGTLSGLPASIADSYESVSEGEEEDEADEDSNAEEYYKNDYPEGENDTESETDSSEMGSDVFHEGSDHGELLAYDDSVGDDAEWTAWR